MFNKNLRREVEAGLWLLPVVVDLLEQVVEVVPCQRLQEGEGQACRLLEEVQGLAVVLYPRPGT